MDLSTALNMPTPSDDDDRPILDPSINIDKLEMLYGQMADILIQLSRLSLPRVGSLYQVDLGGQTLTSDNRHEWTCLYRLATTTDLSNHYF